MTNLEKRSFLWLAVAVLGFWMAAESVKASSVVGFDVVISGFDVREDGSKLEKSDVKAFRLFVVGDSELEALTPDIEYDKESDVVEGRVYMMSDVAAGIADLCAMTIDTFDKISTICSDVVSEPFVVSPPGSPGSVTVTQSMSMQITVTPGN